MKKLALASLLSVGLIFAQAPGAQSSSETTVTRQTNDGKKTTTKRDQVRTDSNTDTTGATNSTTTAHSSETEAKQKGRKTKTKSRQSTDTTSTTSAPGTNP